MTGCGVTPVSTHRSHISWPHWERHRRPQWQGSHDGVTPVLVHLSHVSWPHMGSPPNAPVAGFECWRHARFGTPLTHFVAPMGSSSQGPNGRVRIVAPRLFHAPHTFHGPVKSFTEGPSGRVLVVATRPFRHAPPKLRGLIRSSTQGPSDGVWRHARFGTPLPRCVAP